MIQTDPTAYLHLSNLPNKTPNSQPKKAPQPKSPLNLLDTKPYLRPYRGRRIKNLTEAVTVTCPLRFRGKRRRKGSIAKGVTFEKQFKQVLIDELKHLKKQAPHKVAGAVLHSGQWFQYIDANGPGTCQTDYYIHMPAISKVLLFENKLTECGSGHIQLLSLYVPILSFMYNCQVLPCLVVRNTSPTAPYAKDIESLMGLITCPPSVVTRWHTIHKA